jgi:hypothetical protein
VPICDYWIIIDNSMAPYKIIAEGYKNLDKEVYDLETYNKIVQL